MIFLLGQQENGIPDHLQNESRQYEDLIIGSFYDTYRKWIINFRYYNSLFIYLNLYINIFNISIVNRIAERCNKDGSFN